jgi:hypothetical protein
MSSAPALDAQARAQRAERMLQRATNLIDRVDRLVIRAERLLADTDDAVPSPPPAERNPEEAMTASHTGMIGGGGLEAHNSSSVRATESHGKP